MRIVARLAAILALTFAALLPVTSGVTAEPTPAAAVTVVDEDSADFACSLDGNRQCGVGVDGGPYLVPAADGGEGYVCDALDGPAGVLTVNEAGAVVCQH